MSKGGGGGSTTTTQKIDPWIKKQAEKNIDLAKEIADKPYVPYTGNKVADMTKMQTDALSMMKQFANNAYAQGQDTTDAANAIAQSVGQYQPMQVAGQNISSGSIAAQNINAPTTNAVMGTAQTIDRENIQNLSADQIQGQTAADYMGAYNNPYENQVVQNALNDIDRSRQMAVNQTQDQAISRGAFSGSRAGIAEAETNRAYADQAANTAAQLRSQGFNTALSAGQSDAGNAQNAMTTNASNNLAAQQANQGVDMSVAGANAGYGNQFGMANMAAQNNMNQFNTQNDMAAQSQNVTNDMASQQFNAQSDMAAQQFNANQFLQGQLANQSAGLQGANLNLSAATQMPAISQAGQDMQLQGINTLNQGGAMQQMQNQAEADWKYQQFAEKQNEDIKDLQLRLQAVGAAPFSTSSTQTNNPGMMDTLGGLGQFAANAGMAYMMLSDKNSKTNIRKMKDPISRLKGFGMNSNIDGGLL